MSEMTLARRSARLAAAIVLVALVAGPVAGPARADDEYADLQVELVGLPLAAGQQALTVRVTNVSAWWANETHLRVEELAPQAGNVVELGVENLDPGQAVEFPYSLAAPCSGQVVKAEVSAAPNYAGVQEANLANNAIQGEACAPPPPPAAGAEPPAPPPPAAGGANPEDGTVDYGAVDPGALERLRPRVGAKQELGQVETALVHWGLPCESDGDARGPCAPQSFLIQQEDPPAEWRVSRQLAAGARGTQVGSAFIVGYAYQVDGLSPDRPYRFRVCAEYADGSVCSDYVPIER